VAVQWDTADQEVAVQWDTAEQEHAVSGVLVLLTTRQNDDTVQTRLGRVASTSAGTTCQCRKWLWWCWDDEMGGEEGGGREGSTDRMAKPNDLCKGRLCMQPNDLYVCILLYIVLHPLRHCLSMDG
jgi:hypothetical protein